MIIVVTRLTPLIVSSVATPSPVPPRMNSAVIPPMRSELLLGSSAPIV